MRTKDLSRFTKSRLVYTLNSVHQRSIFDFVYNYFFPSKHFPLFAKAIFLDTWHQIELTLQPRRRGFHLISSEILNAIPSLDAIEVGFLQLFIQHTSASLTINENADPDVRVDMETVFNRLVPENQTLVHTIEGPDDMPAHVKSSLLGPSVQIPIRKGRLALGTWQGIYLCEHRNQGGARSVIITIWGKTN